MARRAFTLIELLVVVAIIAVLIAILVPSLAKARETTRRSKCLANLKGMAATHQMYVAAWESLIPFDPGAIISDEWIVPLSPYGNIEKLRQCPSTFNDNPVSGTPGTSDMPWNQSTATVKATGGYGFNGWLYRVPRIATVTGIIGNGGDDVEDIDAVDADESETGDASGGTIITVIPGAGNSLAYLLAASFQSFYRLPITRTQAEIPVFGDCTWSDGFPFRNDPIPGDLVHGTGNAIVQHMGRFCIIRHGRTINMAYFDGHAENLPINKLWNQNWNSDWFPPVPPVPPF